MQVGAASSVGRVRELNEDAFWVGENCLVVCDGMGGHQAGEIASSMAVETIRGHEFVLDNPEHEVQSVIEQAHQHVLNAAGQKDSLKGMGTTLTMCVVIPTKDGADIIVGHVGDSRAYVYKDGVLRQVTNDHSVVGELIRKGTLSPEEAMLHPQRHILAQALGVGSIEVEIYTNHVPSGTHIMLCTDGLTDVLQDGQLQQYITEYGPQESADNLVIKANELGGPDNITVIIAQIP